MRAEVLSAGPLGIGGIGRVSRSEETSTADDSLRSAAGWDPEKFAQEQIRGLVRQVFSHTENPPVRQVILTAVETETDIPSLCRWIGELLALERLGDIAVADLTQTGLLDMRTGSNESEYLEEPRARPFRQSGVRIRRNLWLMPAPRGDCPRIESLNVYMAELRRDFEYSIVAAPAYTASSSTLAMAQFADGIILVLSAQRTRRIHALRVKDALSKGRFLGTVLSDREFPIPSGIYRRL